MLGTSWRLAGLRAGVLDTECEVGPDAGLGIMSPEHYTSQPQVASQEGLNGVWRCQEHFLPQADFLAALASRAVTAVALKHAPHLAVTRSSLLDKYATGLFQEPGVCMRIPLATPLASSTYKQNGLVMSGRARAAAHTVSRLWRPSAQSQFIPKTAHPAAGIERFTISSHPIIHSCSILLPQQFLYLSF